MTLDRLARHAQIWKDKPELRLVYGVWFDALLAEVPRGARVVEIGAGPGLLEQHARRHRPDLAWVATELARTPWNDVVADAHALPFRSGAADAVLGIDILHHLSHPRAFLSEAARVVKPGGCVALVEPWVTPLSFLVYRYFHQEDCVAPEDRWAPFAAAGEGKDLFDGNAASPRAVVRGTTAAEWDALGLSGPRTELMNAFAYLLTLGFRGASLLPAAAAPAVLWVDRKTSALAPLFALRARLVWTRKGG